jgi:hypothetical protein
MIIKIIISQFLSLIISIFILMFINWSVDLGSIISDSVVNRASLLMLYVGISSIIFVMLDSNDY